MKPDLICVLPDSLDFPVFRQWVHDERERFNRVILVFTKMNSDLPILTSWIENAMKDDAVIFLYSEDKEGDWRNNATNKALSHADSEWIFFTEPDFFPNKNLWEELQSHAEFTDLFAVKQGERMHPCCIFIKKWLLEHTSKEFSANPPEHDHFGQIQKEIEDFPFLFSALEINPIFYHHLNGLTNNLYLIFTRQQPNYKPDALRSYLKQSLTVTVPLHSEYERVVKEYLHD